MLVAARPYFVATLQAALKRPQLVVCASPEDAARFAEQVEAWHHGTPLLLPEPDALLYQSTLADSSAETDRLRVLNLIMSTKNPLVVTSVPAMLHRLPTPGDFKNTTSYVKVGAEYEPYRLLREWLGLGYLQEIQVKAPGTLAHRGGIIDIFPPAAEMPLRLEFFGNTLESLRRFDPATQRSEGLVTSFEITAARDLIAPMRGRTAPLDDIDLGGLNPEMAAALREAMTRLRDGDIPQESWFFVPYFNDASLLDYLPNDTLLTVCAPEQVAAAAAELHTEAEEIRANRVARGELPRACPRPYFTWDEMAPALAGQRRLDLLDWEAAPEAPRLPLTPAPSFAGQLPRFLEHVAGLVRDHQTVVLVSHQAARLSELLEEADMPAPVLSRLETPPPGGSLLLVQGSLAQGWQQADADHVFSDNEIFGFVKPRRALRTRRSATRQLLKEVAPGDYVVHVEHGIARFTGVVSMRPGGREREYVTLEYAEGDRLYVPSDQIDRLGRYVGAGEQAPRLSRLHTQEWARTKARVSEAAQAAAEELLALYASREVKAGHAFATDTAWQREMEAAFPYLETPDQATVWEQVKADMQRPRPMDRLVCGDAGYGKTEVALRAAFKAVEGGRQVAFLVPTTVLAEQHYETFKERFEPFPVQVAVLSRFRGSAAQQAIVEGLVAGRVDVCIGTHRLLQQDVTFKNLGLVIIDEEQRFGVNHKEHLKRLRTEVDVLTLSATPIPRTLHMALAGVRDMSTIETPPEQRLPVKTFVAQTSESLVREAVLREIERGGQVFLVHNRVKSIGYEANRLRRLIPEARVDVAHGQMREDELETVMHRFSHRESDVLVCTTIIESGLDMPNANTLIVNHADRFGLTQLYQLRGRVGRGANLAFAYFLYERGQRLTPVSEQRLRAIFEAAVLGSGFNIAMKDLEIRGAGNILGARQSGHINSVGFHLYVKLLADAVAAEKARLAGAPAPARELPEPSVDLPLAAFIPESYVPDLDLRLGLYQRLALIRENSALGDFALELRDRFGEPPPEVRHLIFTVTIKRLARAAGIESISVEEGGLVLRRFSGWHFNRETLAEVSGEAVRVALNQVRLDYRKLGRTWRKTLQDVLILVAG